MSPVDIQGVKAKWRFTCHVHIRTYAHTPPAPYIHGQAALLKVDPFLLTEEELRAGEAMGLPEGLSCMQTDRAGPQPNQI